MNWASVAARVPPSNKTPPSSRTDKIVSFCNKISWYRTALHRTVFLKDKYPDKIFIPIRQVISIELSHIQMINKR